MADSKISNLPEAPYLLENDLMVVVTGSYNDGSYPETCRVPVGYIPRFLVRLNRLINIVSGLSYDYNSGLNVLTIGHNPLVGNLIRYDYEETRPFNQTISTTGLNAVQGNNIEIQFSSGSPASNIYGGTAGKYYSGIISTTGLNATPGYGLYQKINSSWPHQNEIGTFDKTYIMQPSSPATIFIEPNAITVIPDLIFPLKLPSDTMYQPNTYTHLKYEGRIKELRLDSNLYIEYPPSSIKGPNGEYISWLSYVYLYINEGYIKPRVGKASPTTTSVGFLINDPYMFENNNYYTQHTIEEMQGRDSSFVTYENIQFMGFLPIETSVLSPYVSGCIGFITNSSMFYKAPNATIRWQGTYNRASDAIAQTIYSNVDISGNLSVSIQGYRFLDVKYV